VGQGQKGFFLCQIHLFQVRTSQTVPSRVTLQLEQHKGLHSLSLSIKTKVKGTTQHATNISSVISEPVHTQCGETRQGHSTSPRETPAQIHLVPVQISSICSGPGTLRIAAASESKEPVQRVLMQSLPC